MIGSLAPNSRSQNTKAGNVFLEGLGIELSHFPHSLSCASGTLFHFVITVIFIAGEVSDIGDVYDMLDREAMVFKGSAQHIFKKVRTQIPDMGKMVNGRTATVDPHLGYPSRQGKVFYATACSVIKAKV